MRDRTEGLASSLVEMRLIWAIRSRALLEVYSDTLRDVAGTSTGASPSSFCALTPSVP